MIVTVRCDHTTVTLVLAQDIKLNAVDHELGKIADEGRKAIQHEQEDNSFGATAKQRWVRAVKLKKYATPIRSGILKVNSTPSHWLWVGGSRKNRKAH